LGTLLHIATLQVFEMHVLAAAYFLLVAFLGKTASDVEHFFLL